MATSHLPSHAQTSSATQTHSTTAPGWNLRWRKSSKLTPQPVHVPRQDVFAQPATPPASVSHRQPLNSVQTSPVQSPPAETTNRQAIFVDTDTNPRQTVRTVGMQSGGNVPLPNNPMRSASHSVPQQGQRNVFRTASVDRRYRQGAVMQTGYVQPAGHNESRPKLTGPVQPNASSPGPQMRVAQADDFFNNPFGDSSPPANPTPSSADAPSSLGAQPSTGGAPPTLKLNQVPGGMSFPGSAPAEQQNAVPNNLRAPSTGNPFDQLPTEDIPTPTPEANGAGNTPAGPGAAGEMQMPSDSSPVEQPKLPDAQTPAAPQEETLGDLLKDAKNPRESADDSAPPLPSNEIPESPSDEMDGESGGFENPWLKPDRDADQRERDETDKERLNEDPDEPGPKRSVDGLTCDDFRLRVLRNKIDTFTLDISPPFRPDLIDPKKYEEKRASFERDQMVRDWRNRKGQIVARGRLLDLAYEQIVLETETGSRQTVNVMDLGEGDLGYLTENWELPRECIVEQDVYQPRSWTPITMTWMASNLCSKPRYFEEVNLERYGHTFGPFLQPVVSSAHFFANIAVTPYKMGIHPPNECQYALGYYRPGNCAPWIVPPVPISARGALTQGAFMSGAFWLIP